MNATSKSGRVLLVGAGPGAADLLTLRAARALAMADVIEDFDAVPAKELAAAILARWPIPGGTDLNSLRFDRAVERSDE